MISLESSTLVPPEQFKGFISKPVSMLVRLKIGGRAISWKTLYLAQMVTRIWKAPKADLTGSNFLDHQIHEPSATAFTVSESEKVACKTVKHTKLIDPLIRPYTCLDLIVRGNLVFCCLCMFMLFNHPHLGTKKISDQECQNPCRSSSDTVCFSVRLARGWAKSTGILSMASATLRH